MRKKVGLILQGWKLDADLISSKGSPQYFHLPRAGVKTGLEQIWVVVASRRGILKERPENTRTTARTWVQGAHGRMIQFRVFYLIAALLCG
jgi:hypothetical protein